MRKEQRWRRVLALAATMLATLAVVATTASATTLGPGLAPSPHNPVTYQPLKHTCNSRLPEAICQDFTVDIKTGLNGQMVSLLYTQDYFCDLTVPSRASTRCEFGQIARRLPPGVASRRNTDPLYLMFPSGALARQWPTLQPECQHPGLCTDNPSRIDFSRVLGRGAGNMLLPAHDHFETTRNDNRRSGITSTPSW